MQSSRTQCDFRKATSILERRREKNLACIASVSVRTKSSLPGGRAKIVREKFFFYVVGGGGGGGLVRECLPANPIFRKTRSPTKGTPDWCGLVMSINKCIKFYCMTRLTRGNNS